MLRAAAAAIAVAAVFVGVMYLRFSGDSGPSQNPGATNSPVPQVQVRVCAADPTWIQPSLADILSDSNPMYYYIRGIDERAVRADYERRIYEVAPGNSVNQGWVAVSGLRGVIDSVGCPNALERSRSQGRLTLYALAGFQPVEATREDDHVTVRVRRLDRGWTDAEVTYDPPLSPGGTISFVEESGSVIVKHLH